MLFFFKEQPKPGMNEILNNCVLPSLSSLQTQILTSFLTAFVFIIITRLRALTYKMFHYFSALSGCVVLYYGVFGPNIFEYLTALVSGYLVMEFAFKMRSNTIFGRNFNPEFIMEFVCVLFLIGGEFWHDKELWVKSRGIAMVGVMKIITLASEHRDVNIPTFEQYMGYLLCPGNCLLGVWVPFGEYLRLYSNRTKLNCKWFGRILFTAILGCFFLISSNCLIDQYLPSTYDWFTAYKKALCFRTSHYFVSYMAEAIMLTSGFNENTNNPNHDWSYVLTKPLAVEFPRSLAMVVINWNIPMHRFLKKYIYTVYLRFANYPFGTFVTILITYAFSSLLHGLNVQICMVLLSLGIFSYIQGFLQHHASIYLNACIKIKPCNPGCSHRFKALHPLTLLINILLMEFNVAHLTYLGGVMNIISTSRSVEDTLKKWESLSFTSHHFFILAVTIYYLFFSRQTGDDVRQGPQAGRRVEVQYLGAHDVARGLPEVEGLDGIDVGGAGDAGIRIERDIIEDDEDDIVEDDFEEEEEDVVEEEVGEEEAVEEEELLNDSDSDSDTDED